MIKKASAVWKGGIKDGGGTISSETGVLKEAPYGFKARFENGPGTNPEELIGAALAGCFSMALSAGLEKAGHPAQHVSTRANVKLEMVDGKPTITTIELQNEATVPGIDEQTFQQQAEATKAGCPVSRALAGTNITLKATLNS